MELDENPEKPITTTNSVIIVTDITCPISNQTLQVICIKQSDVYEDETKKEENIKYKYKVEVVE